MTVIITLPPDLEKSVRQQAAKSGQDLSAFVLQAVNEKLAKARTFDEICAPIAKAVAATGISDDEFDRFFNEVRKEVWQKKYTCSLADVIDEIRKGQIERGFHGRSAEEIAAARREGEPGS